MNNDRNVSARGVLQKADPRKWKAHRFGLPAERWALLRGKAFWVTGAGTGYGRCVSAGLAAAGATVFLTGRRREKLFETIMEIESLSIPSTDCHVIEADITDEEEVKEACRRIGGLSALTGLVNNAALPPGPSRFPLLDEGVESWERLMRTNLTAQWLLTREALPEMASGGEIKVLFMTSEAGWASTAGFGQYNVSKAALNSLCSSMAEECAKKYPASDVQMNALVAGEARTEMNRASRESPYSIVSMALILLSHPAGGPNGRFFHRDGRHLSFAYSEPHEHTLI
ncbi:MAG: SDR family oxidoreductase [Deltaproteobacteria bacterium]|nr:SDR family oxidoreductase [Deltaproteobacteria bacterium]